MPDVRRHSSHVLGEQHLVAMVAEHVVQFLACGGECADALPEQHDRLLRDGLRGVPEASSRLAHRVQALGARRSVDPGGASHRAPCLTIEEIAERRPCRLVRGGRERRIGEELGQGGATRGRARQALQFHEPRMREPVRHDLVVDEAYADGLDGGDILPALFGQIPRRARSAIPIRTSRSRTVPSSRPNSPYRRRSASATAASNSGA